MFPGMNQPTLARPTLQRAASSVKFGHKTLHMTIASLVLGNTTTAEVLMEMKKSGVTQLILLSDGNTAMFQPVQPKCSLQRRLAVFRVMEPSTPARPTLQRMAGSVRGGQRVPRNMASIWLEITTTAEVSEMNKSGA